MVDDENVRERVASAETRIESLTHRVEELRDEIRALSARINRFVLSFLTILASGFVGLVTWMFKKLIP